MNNVTALEPPRHLSMADIIRAEWTLATPDQKIAITQNVSAFAKRIQDRFKLDTTAENIRKNVYKTLDDFSDFRGLISGKGNRRYNLKSWVSEEVLEDRYADFVIPESARLLIVPDPHVPYHSEEMIDQVINYGVKFGPTHIIHLGDWGEWTSFSRFGTDPFTKEPSAEEEFSSVVAYFKLFKDVFPGAYNLANLGNHDERVFKEYSKETGKKYGAQDFYTWMPELVNLVTILNHQQMFKCGKWTLAHGHEFWQGRSVPKKPAETIWKGSGKTYTGGEPYLVVGHVHKPDIFRLKDRQGKTYVEVHTLGMVGSTRVSYDPWNKYRNGFATLADQEVDNLFVDDNKVKKLELIL